MRNARNKQAQIDSAWDEFKNPTDLQEWLDYINSEMEAELQYKNVLSKAYAWELYDNPSIQEDIQNSLQEELYANYVAQTMQWHHIEPVNEPYWKQCVDLIEERLK